MQRQSAADHFSFGPCSREPRHRIPLPETSGRKTGRSSHTDVCISLWSFYTSAIERLFDIMPIANSQSGTENLKTN